jgi:hypothetical protein
MIRRRRAWRIAPALVAVCPVLAPALAAAQPPVLPAPAPPAPPADPHQPRFSFASKEEAAELEKANQVEWKLAAQASLILTTGNSRVTNLGAGVNASRKARGNKFSLEAAAAYARSRIFLAVDENDSGMIDPGEVSRPSATTTRSWGVKVRYDRYLTAANALYGAGSISADEPAGKDLVGSGQVGYSRQVYRDDVHVLVAEAGYDLTYEDQVSGDAFAIHSLRGFAGYSGKLGEHSGVEMSIEELSNVNSLDTPGGQVDAFEDNRVIAKLSMTTVLFQDVGFRVGLEARHDNAPAPRPPASLPYAEGFAPLADELDTRAEATLIISFL